MAPKITSTTAPTSLMIDDVKYIREDAVKQQPAPNDENYVIVRSSKAGVFMGELLNRDGDTVTLADARRLWFWAGAATLSELAMRGVGKPKECKFPEPVTAVTVLGVCEILSMTASALASVRAVEVWTSR